MFYGSKLILIISKKYDRGHKKDFFIFLDDNLGHLIIKSLKRTIIYRQYPQEIAAIIENAWLIKQSEIRKGKKAANWL